jgi:ubiquinone/menaquinone biosynthesis C-methylase UbiE
VAGHLENLRQAEIDLVKPYFPPGAHVLEIGGGTGYQASVLHAWGYRVSSIDVAGRPSPPTLYHPMQDYDGRHIPFQDASFDVIFSSNVLEHVHDLPGLLAEMRRVLKPGGLAVHIVPSTSWRFWTSLTHYAYLVKRILFRDVAIPGAANLPSVSERVSRRGWGYMLSRVLFPGPHGEYSSALSELYYFGQARWRRVFQQNGFEMVRAMDNGLFYTGYGLFPGLSLATRRKLARLLGPAGNIFVVRVSRAEMLAP